MKRSVKLITGFFAFFMALFVFYQTIIGNPFFDPIPPIWIYIAGLLLAALAVVAIVKAGREKKSESKEKED